MSTMTITSRRALLRGLAQGSVAASTQHAAIIRPPGALDEVFLSACTRCGDCLAACPEQIIARGDGGFVELDFNQGGCDFCLACVEACSSGALLAENVPKVLGLMQISEACLAKNKVTCQSCKDACDSRAIQFPVTQATPQPVLDVQRCNGCGACVAVCPSNAIAIKPLTHLEGISLP